MRNDFIFFSVNFNDAVAHRNRLRNQPPATYNNVRLREQPIPNIGSEDEGDIGDQNIIQNGIGIVDRNEHQMPIEQNIEDENQANGVYEQEEFVELGLEQILVQNETGDNVVEIKEEFADPIAITEADAAELSRFLNANDSDGDLVIPNDSSSCALNDEVNNSESENESDDSIVWENPEAVVPKPTMYTEDALPKRENDPVSGDMPFAEKVSDPTICELYKLLKSVLPLTEEWRSDL